MATRATKAKTKSTSRTKIKTADGTPEFPHEWISIAAYYIWKNEGEPQGQDVHYWERAKAELAELWKNDALERFK